RRAGHSTRPATPGRPPPGKSATRHRPAREPGNSPDAPDRTGYRLHGPTRLGGPPDRRRPVVFVAGTERRPAAALRHRRVAPTVDRGALTARQEVVPDRAKPPDAGRAGLCRAAGPP